MKVKSVLLYTEETNIRFRSLFLSFFPCNRRLLIWFTLVYHLERLRDTIACVVNAAFIYRGWKFLRSLLLVVVKQTSRPLRGRISKLKTNRLLAFHSRFAECAWSTNVWNEKTLFKEVFHHWKVIVLMYVCITIRRSVLREEKLGSILYEVLKIRYVLKIV